MTKQNKDGWIRHRGGNHNIHDDLMAQYRCRSGGIYKSLAGGLLWRHEGIRGDIMAYRVCEPVIEPVSVDQIEVGIEAADFGKLAPIEDVKAAYAGPLQWRDRITQIDSDIKFEQERHSSNMACMDQERSDLVAKLAVEGFALIAPVVEPVEDMGDWRNWKVGDLLEIECEKHGHCFSRGDIVKIYSVGDEDSDEDCRFKCYDLDGQDFWFVGQSECKFHSRPTN